MFSIIVPVYNCEKYITKCIESVLMQNFCDWELILVDDGSTDNSALICDEFKKVDSRIKVFHQKNFGASAARNLGINNALHKYIIFLDSDDYWLCDDFLEKVNARLLFNCSDVLSVNFCKINKKKDSKAYFLCENMPNYKKMDQRIKYILEHNLWISAAWNKIIKTELIKTNNLFFKEGVTSEDIEWAARLASVTNNFDFLDVEGIAYVQRIDSVSHSMTYKKLIDLKNNVVEIENILLTTGKEKYLLLENYFAYQIVILLLNIASFNFKFNQEFDIKYLKKYLKSSKNKKIRIINKCWQILGYNKLIYILKIMNKMR